MSKIPKLKTAIFDLESNGLLDTISKIHCLVIKDFETKEVYSFRSNESENTIEEGLKILENAELVVGHNIVSYDIPAIELIYNDFDLQTKIRDTLVLSRLVFSNQKQYDFRLYERKALPGYLIGSHSLDAWGYRLGYHKGDYKKEKEKEAKKLGITDKQEIHEYVWGSWNQEMEDYCVNDVEVTEKLYEQILEQHFPEEPIISEHQIHDLMAEVERNGFPFNLAEAEKLAEKLEEEMEVLKEETIAEFGRWYAPAKKVIVSPLWDDPKGINRSKDYAEPPIQYETYEEEYIEKDVPYKYCSETGDPIAFRDKKKVRQIETDEILWECDYSHKIWASPMIPKRSTTPKDSSKPRTGKGRAYSKVTLKEFNPLSRHHIIDRLTIIYGWVPTEFTETGQPKVDDSVLRNLGETIPLAEKLAELFYLKKRLGQIRDGKEAWLKHVKNGKIHSYTNTGGTVSGRCSHSHPNLGQVPAVKVLKHKDGKIWKGDKVKDIPKENYIVDMNKPPNRKGERPAIITGRDGDHGYECRKLFNVPEPFIQIGCDLSGIEGRMLAEFSYQYDNGHLANIILNEDIHKYNMLAGDLPTRDHAKTVFYALIYGAGDKKLGLIVEPLEEEHIQQSLGRQIRRKLMRALPGLNALNNEVSREAGKNWIAGIDGRRIAVRSKYSALNTKLQSAAALIAKKWVLLTRDYMEDEGLDHGWDYDYALLAFIHDELQAGVHNKYHKLYQKLVMQAAADAGTYFDIEIPVDSECKVGSNWAECH